MLDDIKLRMKFVDYIKSTYADDSGLDIYINGEFCDSPTEDEYQKYKAGYVAAEEDCRKEILESIAIGVASDKFGATIVVLMQDKPTGVVSVLATGQCKLNKDVCVRITTE